MILKKQLIMNIGKTENDFIITEEAVKNSLDSFIHKPIIKYEKDGSSIVIGFIHDNVQIENNNVYADILLLNSYRDMWKGKYDNWKIILSDDNKKFRLRYVEVF